MEMVMEAMTDSATWHCKHCLMERVLCGAGSFAWEHLLLIHYLRVQHHTLSHLENWLTTLERYLIALDRSYLIALECSITQLVTLKTG